MIQILVTYINTIISQVVAWRNNNMSSQCWANRKIHVRDIYSD